MVVDVGQWYTHKRQLQNRADAAAFAAGVEYAKNWKACVQDGDRRSRRAPRARSRTRRASSQPIPRRPTTRPIRSPPRSTTRTSRTRRSSTSSINSTTYTDDTDYTDDGAGIRRPRRGPGNPCFVHAADAISPAAATGSTSGVKEHDLPSLFGSIGLPLSRNVARARIEIRPALAGNKFLPLAVPNNVIEKVQVRYFDECRDPGHTSPLARHRDLAPLPHGDQAAFISPAAERSGACRSIVGRSRYPVGDRTCSFALTMPSYGGCGQDYLPIGVAGPAREHADRRHRPVVREP